VADFSIRDGDDVKVELLNDTISISSSPGPSAATNEHSESKSDVVETGDPTPLEVLEEVEEAELEAGEERRRRLLG
jgi:hypothetical protein